MTAEPFAEPQASISQLDFDYIRAMVRKESSIVLDDGKMYLVISRLSPLAREHSFPSVGTFISHLQATAQGELHTLAVDAIVTTETSFFRDLHPFVELRDNILPELIKNKRDTSQSLCIWSAACSSGQEPHSIAMILRDRFPELVGWNLQLLASDISRRMIERAQDGVYTQIEVNRGLPAPYLVRFFNQNESQWQLKDELRGMFRFFRQNLADDWASVPPVDILMLRNVLIYFDVEMRRKVLRQVRRLLRPGGYLVLGSAETTLNLDQSFVRVRSGRTVFYQVEDGNGS
jgi:chemotaxis protein methyltransferase CheR